MDPLRLAQAKLDLATDLGRGLFAESIKLAQHGKYSEAVAVLAGQQVPDVLLGAGVLRGGQLGRISSLSTAARHLNDVPLVFRKGAAELDATLVHDDYVRWVLGPEARQATFETPWTGRYGLGTRKVDDFDELTGTVFEGNTTPWETMSPEKLAHKLDQATADYVLRQTDPRVQRVVWFGTHPLPTTGLGARLAAYLKELGIPYWVVRP